MNKTKAYRFGLLFILFGVIIGLGLSAEFNLNLNSHADASPQTVPFRDTFDPQTDPGVRDLQQISQTFANVAEMVNESVVTITTEKTIQMGSQFQQLPFNDEFFRRFFGVPDNPNQERVQRGLGSGVIVSSDGVVITNNHVVEDADKIVIRLMDGSEFDAEIKGTDPATDLAVLKIDAKNTPAIQFGNSEEARVGEWVLAIGSPLSQNLAHTVTSGIISAKGRTGLFSAEQYEDFIQTDAAINPGNSGGALVNLRGQLVGINSAIASRTGGNMGIGFAIPSNLARKVMKDILEKGRVMRGWLGVSIQNVNPDLARALGLDRPTGVLISGVQENTPAKKAGLKAEDVILELNGRKVDNTAELRTRIASAGPGSKVDLKIIRDGKSRNIDVTLGELPEDQQPMAEKQQRNEKVGIQVADNSSEMRRQFQLQTSDGVVVTDVEQGSIAMESGLRPGDVILSVNRKEVDNAKDYNKMIEDLKAGDSVLFYVQRGEAKIFVAFSIPEK
ncbi:MAG: DegQ family serine endoprotease [Calditrichia bacterium]